MRLDYVTIFPAYFEVLGQSLLGRAVDSGLIAAHVHDLRDWTHDRHRTVDDAPFGGGAGMVMRPEPWGAALDELLRAPAGPHGSGRVAVVVPTPSGQRLTQGLARDLATCDRLVFACGRYEGIDQRVLDLLADPAAPFGPVDLVEVSLGDYVLNGGEVAALAVTEAVVRLLPGFLGNAASLTEESHEDGLLEYPVYTRPASWRGREVPPVLLSGDHAAVAAWRGEQARRRTAARRPDLLPASAAAGAGDWHVRPAVRADAGELLTLQLACWVSEALSNDDLGIPALHEGLEDVLDALDGWRVDVVRVDGRLVGSVRGRLEDDDVWQIGRLMVAPDLRGRGLGRLLLEHVQAVAPAAAASYQLFTGVRSEDNLRMYRRAGFRAVRTLPGRSGPVVLSKPRITAR